MRAQNNLPEVESSRTHFEVLGLGLEASSPRKLACPRLEDSTIFWIVKILWSTWKIFWKTFFCGDRLKNFCEELFFFEITWKIFCEDVFFFFFGEHLRLCPWSSALASSLPVLGLENVCPRKGCPWPWPRIFFVSLALASSLVSSTPLLQPTCVNKFVRTNTSIQMQKAKFCYVFKITKSGWQFFVLGLKMTLKTWDAAYDIFPAKSTYCSVIATDEPKIWCPLLLKLSLIWFWPLGCRHR